MTKSEMFGERYRLKIVRDECGDQIVEGRRGHLYFDGDELCLMALDAPVAGMGDAALNALGGQLWVGMCTGTHDCGGAGK